MKVSHGYGTRKGVHPISWEDFHGLCKGLALAAARFRPQVILPVGRGGYYPGTLIAHLLQVDVYPVRVSRRIRDVVRFRRPRWLVAPPPVVKGRHVLIVDEICGSGETIRMVKKKVAAMGARAVKSAVLYAHTQETSLPDYIGLITDALLLNPWDREIVRRGAFQFHPEYVGALAKQGLKANTSLRIKAPIVRLAKG